MRGVGSIISRKGGRILGKEEMENTRKEIYQGRKEDRTPRKKRYQKRPKIKWRAEGPERRANSF